MTDGRPTAYAPTREFWAAGGQADDRECKYAGTNFLAAKMHKTHKRKAGGGRREKGNVLTRIDAKEREFERKS